MGAGCGETLLLSIGLLSGWSHFGWMAGLMLLASLGFVDPLADRLRALLGLSTHGSVPRNAAERLLRGTIVGLIGLIAFLLNYLIANLAEQQPVAYAAVLAASLLSAGGVTAAWLYGLEHRPMCAAGLGAVVAMAAEGGLRLTLVLLGTGSPGTAGAMIRAGAIGFAGGWVLERWPGVRPSRRCALALTASTALFLALGWALAGVDALDPVFVYGGWALGLVLCPSADVIWSADRRGIADA